MVAVNPSRVFSGITPVLRRFDKSDQLYSTAVPSTGSLRYSTGLVRSKYLEIQYTVRLYRTAREADLKKFLRGTFLSNLRSDSGTGVLYRYSSYSTSMLKDP